MKRTIVYIDNFLQQHGSTPTTGVTITKLFTQQGYTVIRAGTKQNQAARLLEMLGAIRRNRKALVLIAVYSTSAFYFAWACARLCRLLKVQYIPCLHGGNLPQRIENTTGLCAQIFAHSYTNVVVSGYLQAVVTKHGWPCLLIPNSIKLATYPFKLRNNIKPGLLWVRSFHHIYNPTLAIKIVKALSEKYNDITLTMVGPDKDGSLEECKKLAEQLDILEKLTFTGRLTVGEWVKLSATHDIFINTTNFDNLPVSVIEGMALGLPVVSTNVGGLPYLVKNNNNGILVNPNDETAFTEAIEKLLTEPAFTQQLSTQARNTAEQFDEGRVLQLWNNLLQNA